MAPAALQESELYIDKNKVIDAIEQFILKYGSPDQEYLKALLINFVNLTKIRPIDPEKLLAEKGDTVIRFQDAANELQLPLFFRSPPVQSEPNSAWRSAPHPPKALDLYRAWNGYIFVDADDVTVGKPYWDGREYGAVAMVVKIRVHFKDEADDEKIVVDAPASLSRIESTEEELARMKRQIEDMCTKKGAKEGAKKGKKPEA